VNGFEWSLIAAAGGIVTASGLAVVTLGL